MEIAALDEHQTFGDSMLDEIRRTAEQRLQQIEPLLEEAQRLRDVLEVLNRRSAASEPASKGGLRTEQRATGTARSAPPRSKDSRSRSGAASSSSERRAAKGSNKRAIMELAANMPGITAAEISDLTGMKRTVVASTVSRLKRYGELLEHESGGVCVPPAIAAAVSPGSQKPAGAMPRGKDAGGTARRLASLQARRAA